MFQLNLVVMHYEDLLGSNTRVGYFFLGPGFLSSATWPLMLKKQYKRIINRSMET